VKIAIIISVYKNIRALKVILDTLLDQTLPVDEIIISEDGQSKEMESFINSMNIDNLVHITQKDCGWRKNRALNRAIKASSSEYLIFIDGDVALHHRFIEGHISQAKKKRVCAGKRVELGYKYSDMIYDKKISIKELTNSYLQRVFSLHMDGVRHYEDGIYISPNSFLYRYFISKKYINYLIGCNFSCYKKDIEFINGFDEDFILPSIGEDVDINWRFRSSGTEVVSVRNIANVYHLYHKKRFGIDEGKINDKILQNNFKIDRFVCLNGIEKL
jgi:GT2 family glycosyltransferase